VLCNLFWDELEMFVQYMFPVLRLIRLADSDDPILGKVYDTVKQVTSHLEKGCHEISYFQDIYELWLKESECMITDIHRAAYCLDVEF
jgi:hypothetical protein